MRQREKVFTQARSSAPKLAHEKRRVKIHSPLRFGFDDSAKEQLYLRVVRVGSGSPGPADYNPRSRSSAYQLGNGSRDNYLDDAKCEMSLCARLGFAYSTFCSLLSLADIAPPGIVEKCGKPSNRWFYKRQLARCTGTGTSTSTTDLLTGAVTWPRDGHRLILPNYRDMPPPAPSECRQQRVQLFLLPRAFLQIPARGGTQQLARAG